MMTLKELGRRLGLRGKNRATDVRRLLDRMGVRAGRQLYVDLGPGSHTRYLIGEDVLAEVFPHLLENYPSVKDLLDAGMHRSQEMRVELDELREKVLMLTRRLAVLETKKSVPRQPVLVLRAHQG